MSSYCHRHRSLDALSQSAIHQSMSTPASHIAMARYRSSTVNNPKRALDIVRSLIQSEINTRIEGVLQEFCQRFFEPAIKNAESNLGAENVDASLLGDVCVDALEHAKTIFQDKEKIREKFSALRTNSTRIKLESTKRNRKNFVTKWNTKRISPKTSFILASKCRQLLGVPKGRFRLEHPTLFRYICDQADKEWLMKHQLLKAADSKVCLLSLQEVLDLSNRCDTKEKLKSFAFTCPLFVVQKMKASIKASMPPTTINDESQEQNLNEGGVGDATDYEGLNDDMEDESSTLMGEIVEDDDLGFLQGVNLTSLVREFEMEAASNPDSQNLARIFSLADDNSHNSHDDLHDLDFN